MYYELDLTYEDYLKDKKQKEEERAYQDAIDAMVQSDIDEMYQQYIGEFNE